MKKILLAVSLLALAVVGANAAVLLHIQYHQHGIVIRSTGAASDVDDSSTSFLDGVTLVGIMDGDPTAGVPIGLSDTLSATDASFPYDVAKLVDVDDDGTFTDVNIFTDGISEPHAFSTSEAAFIGSATMDAGRNSDHFTGLIGATGEIRAGDADNPGPVLGQWERVAIPEPSQYLMFLGGLIGIALYLRRRR